MLEKTVVLINEAGLHARPASSFVKEAGNYSCNINISKEEKTINGKSIMGILSLGAAKGDNIRIITDGKDEDIALEALISLVESGFGE